MRSVFHTEKKIDRVFDLKGSRLNRKASVGDKVGKDLDILEEGRKLRFVDPKAKRAFLEQLRRDATFLARLGIMDYSLLLGLHQDRDGGGDEEGGVSSDVISTSGNSVDGATSSPIRSSDTREKDTMNNEEPKRSNTPFRRCVLRRAASTDSTKQATNDDGFQALEDLNRVMEKKLTKSTSAVGGKGCKDVVCNESIPQDRKMPAAAASQYDSAQTTKATSISSASPSRAKRQARAELFSPNPITSRSDLGIEGYGVKLEDGSLCKKEIYFCGKSNDYLIVPELLKCSPPILDQMNPGLFDYSTNTAYQHPQHLTLLITVHHSILLLQELLTFSNITMQERWEKLS